MVFARDRGAGGRGHHPGRGGSWPSTRDAANELTGTILPAEAQAYRLQGALVDQETGVRGYAITGDIQFLQPYHERPGGRGERGRAAPRPGRRRAADGRGPPGPGSRRRRLAALTSPCPHRSGAQRGPLTGADLAQLTASKRSFDRLRALFARQNAHLAAGGQRRPGAAEPGQDGGGRDLRGHPGRFHTGRGAAGAAAAQRGGAAAPAPAQRLATGRRRRLQPPHRAGRPGGPVGRGHRGRGRCGAAWSPPWATAGPRRRWPPARPPTSIPRRAELRRSNAELEQFAYVASHDLQEPLRKVASFCQLLRRALRATSSTSAGRQYIDVRGGRRQADADPDQRPADVLAGGPGRDVRVPLPLDQPLDAALASSLSAAIEESAAVIERPGRCPTVTGDPTLLAHALAEPDRQRDQVPRSRRGPGGDGHLVQAAGRPCGSSACTDNGIGIAPEFAEKVFVIFQRLHGREHYPGTGIGLALCKRIVEQHGGEMYLDTRLHRRHPDLLHPAARPGRRRRGRQPDRAASPTTANSAEGIPA